MIYWNHECDQTTSSKGLKPLEDLELSLELDYPKGLKPLEGHSFDVLTPMRIYPMGVISIKLSKMNRIVRYIFISGLQLKVDYGITL